MRCQGIKGCGYDVVFGVVRGNCYKPPKLIIYTKLECYQLKIIKAVVMSDSNDDEEGSYDVIIGVVKEQRC